VEYKWTVFTVTSIGILMAAIDGQIIVVGLPQVARALHADAEQAVWFTQSYIFGSTLTLLMVGKITDTVGRVKIYKVGFAIFTIGSLLTSLSLTPNQVIIFRGVHGLGSAMLTVNTAALLMDAAGGKDIGLLLGLNAFNVRGGSTLGLILSGVILSFFNWRVLFYINVPLGIFGIWWARRKLREIQTIHEKQQVDWIGFGTFAVAMAGLLLSLTFFAYGQASLPLTISLSIISLASFVLFVLQERRATNPMLDLGLFRIRQFSASSLAILLNSISWAAVLILLSLYLQLVRGFSPLQTSTTLIPFQLSVLITGPLSGRFSDRFGRKPFTLSGLILQGIAVFLFSTLDNGSSVNSILVCMVLFGMGTGLFNSPISSSVMESAPPERRGIASAMYSAASAVGSALSLNLAIILMTTIIPYQTISVMLSTGASAVTQLNGLLFDLAIRRTYLVLSMIDFVALIPIALMGKPRMLPSTGRIVSAEAGK
jgi:EmrB/QacA subfamily drug resistance transporter